MKKVIVKEPIKALKKELITIANAMDKVADRYRSIGAIIIAGCTHMSASEFKEAIEPMLNRFKPAYRKQVRAFLTGIHKLAREGVLTPQIWGDERIAALDTNGLLKLVRALKKAPFEEAILIASGNKSAPNKGADIGGRDKPSKIKSKGASINLEAFKKLSASEKEALLKKVEDGIAILLSKIEGGDSVTLINLANFLASEGIIEL